MSKIKVGCLGVGQRGKTMMKTILNLCDNVEIAAVCDLYEDRAEFGRDLVKEKRGYTPFTTTNPDEVIAMEELDAILIFTSWESHVELAVKSMEAGKYTAMEVGGAYTLHDCFKLVDTYEKTGVPCMLLENCCYGKTELTVLQMVRMGLFGEVVHASGGYQHELRSEICGGEQIRHYRLRNYLNRNCENYPTHELGPIAKVLNINRGNRMITLSSFASKSRGLKAYVDEHPDKYPNLVGKTFKQGDVVTTVITCADGATIVLTLDTSLPRAYSRGFTVRGTKCSYFEDMDSFFMDDPEADHFNPKKYWDNADKYREEYLHPLWKKYGPKAIESGHDGIDYMVLSAFFESVEKKIETPIDVYDAAAWMSISVLSEESIAKGGIPVSIPDFTSGKWILPEKKCEKGEFTLDW